MCQFVNDETRKASTSTMIHAGQQPEWTREQCMALEREIRARLEWTMDVRGNFVWSAGGSCTLGAMMNMPQHHVTRGLNDEEEEGPHAFCRDLDEQGSKVKRRDCFEACGSKLTHRTHTREKKCRGKRRRRFATKVVMPAEDQLYRVRK